MSAILRQLVKSGAALYVKQQKRNVAMLCSERILLKNVPLITKASRSFSEDTKKTSPVDKQPTPESLKEDLADVKPSISRSEYDNLVRSDKVVVFMKGTPRSPRCGFSNAVVQIFRMHGVDYASHDVLENEEVREGIKQYTDWPTIPQVFINGEFVGGCDILLEMHQSGELVEELQKVGITSQLLKMEMEIQNKEDEARKNKKKNAKKDN